MKGLVFLLGLPLWGCAPEPASIKLDGGDGLVAVHDMDGVPVKRATVLDKDGKPLDPQPRVSWSADHPEYVTLRDGKLFPVKDGVARVEARVGPVSANYLFSVELDDREPEEPWEARSSHCPVTDYGNGVLAFTCDDENFPSGLASYLAGHGTLRVTAVSPLVRVASNDIHERALVTTYLVVTRSD